MVVSGRPVCFIAAVVGDSPPVERRGLWPGLSFIASGGCHVQRCLAVGHRCGHTLGPVETRIRLVHNRTHELYEDLWFTQRRADPHALGICVGADPYLGSGTVGGNMEVTKGSSCGIVRRITNCRRFCLRDRQKQF